MGHYAYAVVVVRRQRVHDALREVVRTDRRDQIPLLGVPVDILVPPGAPTDWRSETLVEPVLDRDSHLDLLREPAYGARCQPGSETPPGTSTDGRWESGDEGQTTIHLNLSLLSGVQYVGLHFYGSKTLSRVFHDSVSVRSWLFALAEAASGGLVFYEHDASDHLELIDRAGGRHIVWTYADHEDANPWDGVDALVETARRLPR